MAPVGLSCTHTVLPRLPAAAPMCSWEAGADSPQSPRSRARFVWRPGCHGARGVPRAAGLHSAAERNTGKFPEVFLVP